MAVINQDVKIPQRILNTLLASLTAGVVPRSGAPYIAIGRQEEINSLINNLDEVSEGGAFCRFLIGRYGSGKSFLIQLIRGYALDRGFICADADLSPERRLTAGNGAGLATYRELINNLATKTSPDGRALSGVLSRHFTSLSSSLIERGFMPDTPEYRDELRKTALLSIRGIEGDVGGFDFARVLSEYYIASIEDNEDKKNAALRWLRGEYSTKTEAKNALGIAVSTIINDDNWYNYIKLFASLAVKLGYKGLILFIDECVNLYKIPNRISREANYEKLLAIFNDTLQGKANSLGVVFGGTPAFLEDTRRGLFSYEALRSRLVDSKYALAGFQNLSSPVIRLRTLSPNELLALVRRLTILHRERYKLTEPLLTDNEIERFMRLALDKTGAGELVTPREIIRDYLTLLNIIKDNKDASFERLIGEVTFSRADIEEEAEDVVFGANGEPVSVGLQGSKGATEASHISRRSESYTTSSEGGSYDSPDTTAQPTPPRRIGLFDIDI